MRYSYEIIPRPAELGGGWRLRLLNGDQEEGGGVFPPEKGYETEKEALQAAFEDAEATAYEWLDAREREERAYQVGQMLANQRLEGLEPDQAHQQLLQEYIDGTASLDDLLRHAQGYAYEQWFRAQVQEAIDDPRPSIPHDQVMADVRARLESIRSAHAVRPQPNSSEDADGV